MTEIVDELPQTLSLNAEQVAVKARKLRDQLVGRKAGIKSRHPVLCHPGASAARSLPSLHPGYNLKEDLLNQFTKPARSVTSALSQSPQVSESNDDPLSPHFVHERMNSTVERLPKGGLSIPRYDLCWKRNIDCIKKASTCEACTKKHAKCAWHNGSADEASSLVESVKDVRVAGGSEPGSRGSSSEPAPARERPPLPQSLETASRLAAIR